MSEGKQITHLVLAVRNYDGRPVDNCLWKTFEMIFPGDLTSGRDLLEAVEIFGSSNPRTFSVREAIAATRKVMSTNGSVYVMNRDDLDELKKTHGIRLRPFLAYYPGGIIHEVDAFDRFDAILELQQLGKRVENMPPLGDLVNLVMKHGQGNKNTSCDEIQEIQRVAKDLGLLDMVGIPTAT